MAHDGHERGHALWLTAISKTKRLFGVSCTARATAFAAFHHQTEGL